MKPILMCVLFAGLMVSAAADETVAPTVSRVIFEHHDQSGVPGKVLKAGDSLLNVGGALHSLSAAPGEQGGTAVCAWIFGQGPTAGDARPLSAKSAACPMPMVHELHCMSSTGH